MRHLWSLHSKREKSNNSNKPHNIEEKETKQGNNSNKPHNIKEKETKQGKRESKLG